MHLNSTRTKSVQLIHCFLKNLFLCKSVILGSSITRLFIYIINHAGPQEKKPQNLVYNYRPCSQWPRLQRIPSSGVRPHYKESKNVPVKENGTKGALPPFTSLHQVPLPTCALIKTKQLALDHMGHNHMLLTVKTSSCFFSKHYTNANLLYPLCEQSAEFPMEDTDCSMKLQADVINHISESA